jgi:hypothetical protein
MGLTKTSDSNMVFLRVKHYSLWREIKKPVQGCEEIEVTNPKTGAVTKKYGYKFRTLTGRAVKLLKYDTLQKYTTRYFGFKLHVQDKGEVFVLDMPYYSQILRRFLRVAPNIDWSLPFSITIFKGKGNANGAKNDETTGVWFQQKGETVKPYYSKEVPHDMPAATFDDVDQKWDFKDQHRWLVQKLIDETMPDIEAAAARIAPPAEHIANDQDGPEDSQEPEETPGEPLQWDVSDDDVPF